MRAGWCSVRARAYVYVGERACWEERSKGRSEEREEQGRGARGRGMSDLRSLLSNTHVASRTAHISQSRTAPTTYAFKKASVRSFTQHSPHLFCEGKHDDSSCPVCPACRLELGVVRRASPAGRLVRCGGVQCVCDRSHNIIRRKHDGTWGRTPPIFFPRTLHPPGDDSHPSVLQEADERSHSAHAVDGRGVVGRKASRYAGRDG